MTSESLDSGSTSPRIFTVRSLFFSALGIFFMSGLAGFHDWVLKGSPMIGNQLPVGAFSYMMFVGIFWNVKDWKLK